MKFQRFVKQNTACSGAIGGERQVLGLPLKP